MKSFYKLKISFVWETEAGCNRLFFPFIGWRHTHEKEKNFHSHSHPDTSVGAAYGVSTFVSYYVIVLMSLLCVIRHFVLDGWIANLLCLVVVESECILIIRQLSFR